jgi:signal transduction histidine kinase/CheY-like chemotaxis protein
MPTDHVARVLADIAHALTSPDQADLRVRHVLDHLRLLVPYDCCALLEAEPGRAQKLVVLPEGGARGSVREVLARLLRDLTEPATLHSDLPSPEVAAQLPHRAYLVLPIVAPDLIGLLYVGKGAGDYSEEHLRLLAVVASQVGAYLRERHLQAENARLYEEVKAASAAKDEFLAMLAHELRNPLTPVRNGVALLRRLGAPEPRLQSVHDMIDRQVRHMARLLDDLLDVSRVTRGKITLAPVRLDVREVIRHGVEATRPLMEQNAHQLHVRLAPEPLWVEGDETRLAQVVGNLLTNAAKFTPSGGTVEVSVTATGDRAEVRVRDTGVGLLPQALDRIFHLFSQEDVTLDRQQGGLGIGLTLVKQLVELHGGTVEARSAGRGCGSEFVVRLPLLPPALPLAATPAEGRAASRSSRLRVLIVEDNIDTAKSLAALLALDSHEVRIAADGATALCIAQAAPPDLALVDIELPEMSGYEVVREMRALPEGQRIAVVAITGYGREEDRERSRAAGFDQHLVKPIDLDALHALLAEVGKAGSPRARTLR